MSRLLVSSGNGPAECRMAVVKVLREMEREAGALIEIVDSVWPDKHGPASAIVMLDDRAFAKRWQGTILWRCQSPIRPQHKRQNWFVGVFDVADHIDADTTLNPQDLRYERFRAGGPGGQHQNTTDSAVRVVHLPSGMVAASREQRSQHRNKAQALRRLEAIMLLAQTQKGADDKVRLNLLHSHLQRGNPVRRFSGVKFRELT